MAWLQLFSAENLAQSESILADNFDQEVSLYEDQVAGDILDGKDTFAVTVGRRWEAPGFGFDFACPCGASRCHHAAALLKLADVVFPSFTDALAQPHGVDGETAFEIVEIPGPYARVGLRPVRMLDGKPAPVAFRDLPYGLQKMLPEQPLASEAALWAIDDEGDAGLLKWLLGLKRFAFYHEGHRIRVTDNTRALRMVPAENPLAKFHQPVVDGFAKLLGADASHFFDSSTWEIGTLERPGYPPFWRALLHGNDFVKDLAEHETLMRELYPADWVDFAFPKIAKAA